MSNTPHATPAARIRDVVIATRAVHAMAVNHDATPTLANALASLCACMMRGGLPGVAAFAKCEEIALAAGAAEPVMAFLAAPLQRAA